MIKSLRWRLQAWYALVLLGVLAGFGVIVYELQWQTRLQQIDVELGQRTDYLISRLRRMPFGSFPPPRSPGRWSPFPAGNSPPPAESLPRPLLPSSRPVADPTSEKTNAPDSTPHAGETPPAREAGSAVEPRTAGESPSTVEAPAAGESSLEPREGRDLRDRREPRDGRESPGSWGRRPWDRSPPQITLSDEFLQLFQGNEESRLYFVLWNRDGEVLQKSALAPEIEYPALKLGPDGIPRRVARSREQRRELIHASYFDLNLLVGRSLQADIAAQRRAGGLLALVGLGVLAAGMVGGRWVVSRAIRPISSMTATADAISIRTLSERIDLQETDSELGQLASVLNRTFDRLQSAFEQQSRFTADASHELRTPIAVILAHTELALSRTRSGEDYRAALVTCQRASQRMKSLIDSMLMLARLDAGQTQPSDEPWDLGLLVRDSLDLMRPLAEERRISLRMEGLPVEIPGDRDRIGQVLTNLLSNAIRHSREGGDVLVSVETCGAEVVLRVTDWGTGIPAEDLPHIFDRFYRVEKARTRSDGGSGLGLAICKAIVEAHGGVISAQSESQVSTTIEVRLPWRAAEAG